jgi:predicted amidohydrolase
MIISPRGEVVAEADTGRHTVLHCELDLEEVKDWYLSQQRSDVVAIEYLPGTHDRR